jgi:hypothetical protein
VGLGSIRNTPDGVDGEASQQWRARLVDLLEIGRASRVLVIGARTGKTAALLCALLGDRRVDVAVPDGLTAGRVRDLLAGADLYPYLIVGTEELGTNPRQYARVVVPTACPDVDHRWIRAVEPGGKLLAALSNPFGRVGLVRLTAGEHWAAGPFVACVEDSELCRVRSRFSVFDFHADPYAAGVPEPVVLPEDLWKDLDASFVAGLRLPGVGVTELEVDTRTFRWFYDATSWCRIEPDTDEVVSSGPRRLAQEIAGAYNWWVERGRPAYREFGLTVAAFGTFAWYDSRTSGYLWAV